jgi:hypothetical protein
MKKFLISIAAAGMLAGCSGQGEESGPPETEVKNEDNPVTTEYLQQRFTKGMDVDAYAVEIQTWVDKGQAEIVGTVRPAEQKNVQADIIQVSNGFLAVANDGKEITFVKPFASPEDAEKYIHENM